jgi:hypothetical protein
MLRSAAAGHRCSRGWHGERERRIEESISIDRVVVWHGMASTEVIGMIAPHMHACMPNERNHEPYLQPIDPPIDRSIDRAHTRSFALCLSPMRMT